MRRSSMHLCLVTVLILAACASGPANLSSVGRYSDASTLPAAGHSVTRTFDGTFDEVWDASRQAIARLGWFVEEADRAKGRLNGNGQYQGMCLAGPCGAPTVFGLFYKDLGGREPRVQVIAHAFMPTGASQGRQGGHPETVVNRIMAETQKSLAAVR